MQQESYFTGELRLVLNRPEKSIFPSKTLLKIKSAFVMIACFRGYIELTDFFKILNEKTF